MKKKIDILVCNHYDLAWRRRAYEPLLDQGRSFVSYADLQRYGIEENLRFCRKYPFYKFNIESVSVLRHFLRTCPQYKTELLDLIGQNRCSVPQSGDNIIDTNLVMGESIVRNFTEGHRQLTELFGEASTVCVRNDAFGNSAQLPQIAAQCGCDWIWGLSYTPVKGTYWRGLDGTTLYVGKLADAGSGGSWKKYAPCSACRGVGCDACAGLGIDREGAERTLQIEFSEEIFQTADEALLSVTSEEMLPTEALICWYEQMQGRYDVRFVTYNDLHDLMAQRLTATPTEAEIMPTAEHNPNNTGCYTARIRTKTEIRALEHRVFSLEKLAVLLTQRGGRYPLKELDAIWEKLLTVMAHDIVTGEHIDAVYEDYLAWVEQLNGMVSKTLGQITEPFVEQEGVVTVWNPNTLPYTGAVRILTEEPYLSFYTIGGEKCPAVTRDASSVSVLIPELASGETVVLIPKQDPHVADEIAASEAVVGSYGNVLQATGMTSEADKEGTAVQYQIENQYYRLTADDKGILSAFDLRQGIDLTSSEQRPIRLIYEHDEGSPWATLSDDRREVPVQTVFKKLRKEEALQSLTYTFFLGNTDSYAIHALQGEMEVLLYRDNPQIDFRIRVFSDDYNHRLRIAFAVASEEKERSLYGIPYGALERHPYEAEYFWAGSNGDWPAIHWAGIDRDRCSVAVFDRGTPSYEIVSGEKTSQIAVSLLRSPCIPTYLHEPSSYSMTAWDGMRDVGWHSFELAFRSYAGALQAHPVSETAESFSCGLIPLQGKLSLPALPFVLEGNVRLGAMLQNQAGETVLRLVETKGKAGEAWICLSHGVTQACRSDLIQKKEKNCKLRIKGLP